MFIHYIRGGMEPPIGREQSETLSRGYAVVLRVW